MRPDALARKVLDGDVRAVARACRLVDDRVDGYRGLLRVLYDEGRRAWVVGVTGNPGAGKSTLTDRVIGRLRSDGCRVGVIAVDPTSPFSGGAILGDRIRMQRHFEDPEVFIRSVATRGALGGLSRSATDLTRVLAAWGADIVLVETVGVGQDELEVTRAAHTTLVVTAPGLGDEIQAIKAGLMECADVFAVNKADRDGADQTVRDIELMIALGGEVVSVGSHSRRHAGGVLDVEKQVVAHDPAGWTPPIVKCVATKGDGVEPLVEKLREHERWLAETEQGRERRSARLREQMAAFLRDALAAEAFSLLGSLVEEYAARVEAGEIDPYSACDRLIARFRGG